METVLKGFFGQQKLCLSVFICLFKGKLHTDSFSIRGEII